jgi:hypothetical protein
MSKLSLSRACLLGGTFALAAGFCTEAAAQAGYTPKFQTSPMGWEHPFGNVFQPVPGSALPVWNDPTHPHFNNEMARINKTQSNYWISDLNNPNLTDWAKAQMKKDNDEVLKGKIAFTPGQACTPYGVPYFSLAQGPVIFIETPKKITMVEESSQTVRQIYMNEQHPSDLKPSTHGHSIGHYEGDTLVVETVGISTKSFIDPFRTPHSDKLRVVERYRIVEGGHIMEVKLRIEDPVAFVQPWETVVRYRPADTAFGEIICQEGNLILFTDEYGVPRADKPDF